jgi:hypothetical protein
MSNSQRRLSALRRDLWQLKDKLRLDSVDCQPELHVDLDRAIAMVQQVLDDDQRRIGTWC